MIEQDKTLLQLGKITGVFGVKGWVKVFSNTEPREGITQYPAWLIKQQGQWREVKVLEAKRQAKTVIARLDGIDDRDQAQLLTGAEVAIYEDQLPNLPENEYYWRDLIGCHVVNIDGVDFGVVESMMQTGANDVLIVKGERERLIPFTQGHAVLKVDLSTAVISVDWDADF